MCQNQSLADSNAQIAEDLRRQVLDLMRQGKSDDEIKLPPAPVLAMTPLAPLKVDDAERLALKEQRKARKAAEQEEARRRREQIAKARRK